MTVCWTVPDEDFIDGYVLEIDDGSGGDFREVYCGKEDICTVDGLHFDSLYKARVKAFSNYGEGDYSELVCLQTAEGGFSNIIQWIFNILPFGNGKQFLKLNSLQSPGSPSIRG